MSLPIRALFAVVCLFLWAPSAGAQITLPHGQVVPVDSGGEKQLYELFAERGETIDWINDASAAPDTFSPLCGFSATLVLKESGSSLGVGWYNVVPGATMAPSALDIFEILPAGSGVGSTVAGSTIRDDPRYLGGAVGFALLRFPPYFTEQQFNIVCDQGPCAATPGHWILSLSYRSTLIENAYYVAFEDGETRADGWNNDGDYNDYVFLFSGIACAGAGEPCEVAGTFGVCATGLTECDEHGVLGCKAVNAPSAETCDGVDNDCDGTVDVGDGICPEFQECVAGNCVPHCGDEFPCLYGDVCDNDLCVHPDCVGVTCPDGQACRAGTCRAPCDGVVCPGDQLCRVGTCVDACAGVVCGDDRVCQGGVCVLPCSCQGCHDALACDADSGRCVDAGCEQVSCGAGEVCRAGACQDACLDAQCPADTHCAAGQCEPGAPMIDAGVDGTGTGGAAVVGGNDAFGGTAAVPGSGGTGDTAGGSRGRGDDGQGGCGCRLPGPPRGHPGALWLLALGLLLLRHRAATRAGSRTRTRDRATNA